MSPVFEVGKTYRNRVGEYTVQDIDVHVIRRLDRVKVLTDQPNAVKTVLGLASYQRNGITAKRLSHRCSPLLSLALRAVGQG